jgi:hypothetical protein
MNYKIVLNEAHKAILLKVDKNEPWLDNDHSNENLLKILNRTDKIKRVQYEDCNGIADQLNIYFE